MNDPLAVGRRQRRGNLAADAQPVGAQGTVDSVDARGQGLPVQVLHDDVGGAIGQLAEVEAADDAGVVDDVDGAGFVEKPGHHLLVGGKPRMQDLDGGVAANRLVHRLKDRAHPAIADFADDFVVADKLTDHDASPENARNRTSS
jgi:hypothetical protein